MYLLHLTKNSNKMLVTFKYKFDNIIKPIWNNILTRKDTILYLYHAEYATS